VLYNNLIKKDYPKGGVGRSVGPFNAQNERNGLRLSWRGPHIHPNGNDEARLFGLEERGF
jgi:hypothetical protein